MSPDADLIGSIYEASSITERWPRVLERLSDVAGCFGATLVTVDPVQNVRFVATESLQSFMDVFVRDGWMPRNSRAGRLAPKRYHGFVKVLFRSQAEWAASPNPMTALERVAKLGGIDETRFTACTRDEKVLDQILASRQEAERTFQVNSTPTFIIQGRKYTGSLTLDGLREILDSLAKGS